MFQLRKALIGAGVLLAAGVAASAASAAPGFVTSRTSLLAGPGGQYPVVARMRAGDRVEIFGCVRGLAYCDIAWEDYRGWARGDALQAFYRDRRVSLYQYAPIIGIPFVSFSISSYWGSHYHNQPFYNQAYRWGGARDNDRRDNDGPKKNYDNDGPKKNYQGNNTYQGGTTYQGNTRFQGTVQGGGTVNVEPRNRSYDMQGNANIGGQPNLPPKANQENRRGGAFGSNTGNQPNLPPQASDNNRRGGTYSGKCPPGLEKQGKCNN